MMKAKHLRAAIFLAGLMGLGMGCELIASIDRGKIDNTGGAAGNGGTTTTGGGGATGGSTGGATGGTTGGGGMTGGGGTGGTMCVPVDDNNECTDDICDAENMPAHVNKTAGATCMTGGSMCDGNGNCVECLAPADCPGDDNACQTRTCDQGTCGFNFVTAGTAVPEQALGNCKLAVCDGAGAIVDSPDDADLPVDNNDCTDDVCNNGAPSNPPKTAGTSCGAALLCDGVGNCVGCNVANDCPGADDECKYRTCVGQVCGFSYIPENTPVVAQTPANCTKNVCDGAGNVTQIADDADVPADDGNACTDDSCAGGAPIHPNKANGTSCDDSDACTQTDTCESGTCTGGNAVTCIAADQCHDAGSCDPATGACSNPAKANGSPCEDGNACTQTDTCQAGACQAGTAVTCAALDQCHTAGVCDPATGMCSNPNKPDGSGCNDGNPCTQTDTCQAGACSGANPKTCTPSDQCHDAGTCDPATGACSNPVKADGTSCSDNNACTQTDTCQAGACTGSDPKTCTASDQCHDAGSCIPATGACTNPAKANGSACDDNDACTQTDTCQAGACSGGNPKTCTPSDQCHDAGSCNPADGTCSNPAKADGSSCNDNDACTQTDTCQAGACSGGNPKTCTASDQCHDAGSCNPADGTCSNPNKADGSACNDNDACTQTDTCQAGACSGGNPKTCTALDQCHVAGSCNPADGICSNPNQIDGTTCENGGVPGACANGVCGTCGDGTPQAGELCDDGNFVNGDGCDNNCTPSACGNGVAGGTELCDDGNLVDGDGCDSNCTPTACGNGVLTGSEVCDDGNAVNGDGCDNNCTATACGNGVVTGTETCDDGNGASGDGCDANCTVTACGNGIVTSGEQCDDGNLTSDDGCDANCTPTACGNGVVTGAEVCDDGNTANNDGCTSKCAVEAPYACAGTPSVCTSSQEINCNDGKDNDGDGTSDCADTDCALGCNANVGPCGAGEVMLTYTATDTPKTILDNTPPGAVSDITVGGVGQIKRVVAQTNITHSYDADLDISLKSPSGLVTDVSSDNGSSGANYTDTIFNTACATSVTAGSAPFNGCYKPEAAFTTYNNSPAKGTWTWTALDDAGGGAGTLNTWRLSLCVAQTSCGDAATDAGEQCDDGNAANGDGCDNNCTTTACGNGVVAGAEACDDGNAANGDGCSSTCTVEAGYSCSGNPSVCGIFCGDGVLGGAEACDDGNTASGDCCSSACQIEAGCGTEPNNTPATATALTLVGNTVSILGSIPVATDVDYYQVTLTQTASIKAQTFDGSGAATCSAGAGNHDTKLFLYNTDGTTELASNDDGGVSPCSLIDPAGTAAARLLPPGTYYLRVQHYAQSNTIGLYRLVVTLYPCGDGVKESFEGCDDGNNNSGDGCAPACTPEAGYSCTGSPSVCSIACGDGVIGGAEQCDDGNTVNGDCCSSTCTNEAGCEAEVNNTPATATELTLVGNTVSILGSIPVASDVDYYKVTLTQAASIKAQTFDGSGAATCNAGAGNHDTKLFLYNTDGTTELASNDDGGVTPCSLIDPATTPAAVSLPPGTYYLRVQHYSQSNTIGLYRLVVTLFPCGDGTKETFEACDDSNNNPGDGCSAVCKVETGYQCNGSPSVCALSCGDGVINGADQCDDSNTTNNDGCSSTCVVEPGYTCTGAPSTCTFTCGDGAVTGSEQCDDGNLAAGDGCGATCLWEVTGEVEPNDTTAQADAALPVITGSANITAAITPSGDVDIFKVSVASTGVVRFETFDPSGRDCTSALIPASMTMTLLDSAGATLKTDSVTSGIGLCPQLTVLLGAGTYYVKINKTSTGTVAAYMLQVRFQTNDGSEIEPNDTQLTATPMAGHDMQMFGDHTVLTDADWYQIVLPVQLSLRIETIEGDLPSAPAPDNETCESNGIDSTLTLFNSAGTSLGSDYDTGRGWCSQIDGTGTAAANSYAKNLAAGTYYVRVTSNGSSGASNQFKYHLSVVAR